nr:MAG TPA: hypothetical protein [Caudoviricetes sp.]
MVLIDILSPDNIISLGFRVTSDYIFIHRILPLYKTIYATCFLISSIKRCHMRFSGYSTILIIL